MEGSYLWHEEEKSYGSWTTNISENENNAHNNGNIQCFSPWFLNESLQNLENIHGEISSQEHEEISPYGLSSHGNCSMAMEKSTESSLKMKTIQGDFSPLGPMEDVVIAIDVMGGDHAPGSIMDGLFLFHQDHPNVFFRLFGREDCIKPYLRKYPSLGRVSTIVHTLEAVDNTMKVSHVLRGLPQCSMRLALQAVASREAHGALSAGNTGAYLALAKTILKTMSVIDRPAIISQIPTKKGSCVMLDLGGTLEASSQNLFEYALMGSIFAQSVLSLKSPLIGLLNVGSEETKGNDCLQQAFRLLQGSSLNFYGFVEGHDIPKGLVDVVVVNGFSGNIALKTAEGMASFLTESLKNVFHRNLFTKSLGFFLKPYLKSFKDTFDPRIYNGALWLGLNGIAVKSHGGTDSIGFYHALKKTHVLIQKNILQTIQDGAKLYQDSFYDQS